jgi:hypothetical protein
MQRDSRSALPSEFFAEPGAKAYGRKLLAWVEVAGVVLATTIAVTFVSLLAVMIGLA